MIYYNMRYRGPYEYDKFTLNVFNYINYVNDYIYDVNNLDEEIDTFKQLQNDVDEAFEKTLKHSEDIYKYLIINRGE